MKITNSTKIDTSAEKIWKTIRAYDKVESFNPMVLSSTITGTDEGAQRVCQVQFGDQKGEILENLDFVDEESKTMKVSVTKAPPPLGGLQVTIKVKSLSENKAEVLISTEVKDGNEQVSTGIQGIFQVVSDGLKKFHEKEVI